jgi:hypothetical protein
MNAKKLRITSRERVSSFLIVPFIEPVAGVAQTSDVKTEASDRNPVPSAHSGEC